MHIYCQDKQGDIIFLIGLGILCKGCKVTQLGQSIAKIDSRLTREKPFRLESA